jgi:MFS family permease
VSNISQKKVLLFPLLLINFTGTLGYSIVLPFLVFLVTEFGGDAIVYGLLAATYPTFQLIGAPILGRWSDIYGRKKVLLLSHGGTLAGWVIFLVALYLPNETLSINITMIGAMITYLFRSLYYFLPELLMDSLGAMFQLLTHTFQIYHQMKTEAKTLERWQYRRIWDLLLDLH